MWARLLPYYLAGMVFYLYRDRIPCTPLIATISLAAVISSAFVPHAVTIALPTAGAYLVFYFAFTGIVRLPHWAKYGDFSYGIYLCAFPIQQFVVASLGRDTAPLTVTAIAMPLTLAAAVTCWYCIESPFLRLKPTPSRNAASSQSRVPQQKESEEGVGQGESVPGEVVTSAAQS
jgi:peptidoglycan/LPS O-acetylase OafA/YrhL